MRVFIAIGSNIHPEQNIPRALAYLKSAFGNFLISPFFLTKPLYWSKQPAFWNGVVQITTDQAPEKIFALLQAIEQKCKRKRIILNGPRTIDLDFLLYGQQIISLPFLQIPHPRMHERDFVLKPLSLLAPEQKHPIKKKTIKALLFQCKQKTILHPLMDASLFSWQKIH